MSSTITNYLPADVNILPIPNFASELQLKIISFCDPEGLIHLSGVKYSHLEAVRTINQSKKEFYTQKLAKFLSNPAEVHLKDLSDEWGFARMLELRLKSKDPLEKCRVFAKNLVFDHLEQQCPEAFEEIRRLVNECDNHYGTNIWEELYHRSGRGVIEDSWAEKHFRDYLPELLDAIVDLLHDVEHKTLVARRNYSYESPLSRNFGPIPINKNP